MYLKTFPWNRFPTFKWIYAGAYSNGVKLNCCEHDFLLERALLDRFRACDVYPVLLIIPFPVCPPNVHIVLRHVHDMSIKR